MGKYILIKSKCLFLKNALAESSNFLASNSVFINIENTIAGIEISGGPSASGRNRLNFHDRSSEGVSDQ